jgi:ATP-dependent RNA helicase RhlE
MLDMGFIHDVRRIISKLPKKRQTLFFSATMPPPIMDLSRTILTDPAVVEITPASTAAQTVQQGLYYVDRANKVSLLIHVLQNTSAESTLVFTRTKHGADKLTRLINQAGITAEAIHGNKAQNARQRALNNFKDKKTRVLVATDIAARGIDIDELEHVVNYDIPNEAETYIHRIGRTGRAGASGMALSFCDWSEKEYLKDIHKLLGGVIPVATNHPFPMSESIPEDELERMKTKKQPRGPRPRRDDGQSRGPSRRRGGRGR